MNNHCLDCIWYGYAYEHAHACYYWSKIVEDNEDTSKCEHYWKHKGVVEL